MKFEKGMTLDQFIKYNPNLVKKERGRWGTWHYRLNTNKGDYQSFGACASDTAKGVYELIFAKLRTG